MSSFSTGDLRCPGTPDSQARSENVPELIQLFQAQNASSPGPSQSNAARDIIKAGHRRLRQLAQRQKKPTDPKIKAEEASRHLLALQQEGFLPAPWPKRSGPKHSIDSTASSSLSISNLSFKSNSRRDVESIGQPWLGDAFERQDKKGNSLASMDPRDLRSLVEASISQYEGNPPPYQPHAQPNCLLSEDGLAQLHSAMGGSNEEASLMNEGNVEALPKFPDVPDQSSSSHAQHSRTASTSNSTTNATADDARQPDTKQTQEADSSDSRNSSEAPSRKSSSSTQPPSNTVSQTLKLFPDTMPPRVSSKGAWRISNGVTPAPNRPLPAAPELQQVQTGTKAQSGSEGSRSNGSTKGHKGTESRGNSGSKESTANNSGNDKLPQSIAYRRPSSLPMGSIDAFPLPAPMRPLPSLPEPITGILAGRDRRSSASKRPPQAGKRGAGLRAPFSSSVDDLRVVSTESGDFPMPRSAGPSKMTESKDSAQQGASKGSPTDSESAQLVRTGQSRAERVRALKMKDMSATRLYLKDSEKPRKETEEQTTERLRLSTAPPPSRHNDASPPSSSSSQSLKPSTKTPVDGQISEKRHCSSPLPSSSEPVNGNEPSTLSVLNRNSQVSRSSSGRSGRIPQEKVSSEHVQHDRSETPLPSSDDEGVSIGTRKDPHQRPASAQPPRTKPASFTFNDAALHKARHSKKKSIYDTSIPTTPRSRRSRGLDRFSPQSYVSQSTHYSQDSRDGRHRASYVLKLEGRIANLERQNKVLQAALLAALDVGANQQMESLFGGSSTSHSTPGTGRSSSSTANNSSADETKGKYKKQPCYRPESWIASPGSSRASSCGTYDSANVRELEDMIEDFDFDWMSDKSSPRGQQSTRA